MSRLQFLQQQKTWCLDWLEVPESELPGELTHDKILQTLEDTEDELIDYLALRVEPNKTVVIYSE